MEKEVKLFDKRFVYFMWDDELKGKKVFLSNDIDNLRGIVEKGTECDLHSVISSGDESAPFESANGVFVWQFAYYDPNYEVKRAFYKEGKQIQVAYKGANNWVDCDEPEWVDGCQFRVKPDEEKRYRPYAETAEMIYDFTNRFPAVYPRSSVCEPMIWLKKKNSVNDGRKLVVCFTNSWVLLIDSKKLFMNELLEEYTYLDGSPVGMEVKE